MSPTKAIACLALLVASACGGGTESTDAAAMDAGVATDLATPPPDASAPDIAAAPDLATHDLARAVDLASKAAVPDGGLPLYAVCAEDGDCASMACRLFPGRMANYCTMPCKADGDCPAPSPGCNGMGYCRVP